MASFLFLFETLGHASAPFTAAGHTTYIVDTLNTEDRPVVPMETTRGRATHILNWDILHHEKELVEIARDCAFVFGFPPCTDLAVSGASRFAAKARIDPLFQQKAMHLFRATERIGTQAGVPWAIENPVSVAATRWRTPDYYFHPFQFGGYLPEDDCHPDFPRHIIPRDAYRKNTCIWHSPGFRLPNTAPVPCLQGTTHIMQLGGKSLRTKMVRSASPRGFFTALATLY